MGGTGGKGLQGYLGFLSGTAEPVGSLGNSQGWCTGVRAPGVLQGQWHCHPMPRPAPRPAHLSGRARREEDQALGALWLLLEEMGGRRSPGPGHSGNSGARWHHGTGMAEPVSSLLETRCVWDAWVLWSFSNRILVWPAAVCMLCSRKRRELGSRRAGNRGDD